MIPRRKARAPRAAYRRALHRYHRYLRQHHLQASTTGGILLTHADSTIAITVGRLAASTISAYTRLKNSGGTA